MTSRLAALKTKDFWTSDFPAHWADLSTSSALIPNRTLFSALRIIWLSTGVVCWAIYISRIPDFRQLTQWSVLLQTIFCLSAIASVIWGLVIHSRGQTNQGKGEGTAQLYKTPWAIKVIAVLRTISFASHIIITILYWVLIAPRVKSPGIYNALGHGIPLFGLTLDLLLCPLPVYLNHMVYSIGYGATYMVYSATYTYATGNAIYPPLDYVNSPFKAWGLIAPVVFIATPLIFLLAYSIHQLHHGLGRIVNKSHAHQTVDPEIPLIQAQA